jgi:hypothetical protein
MYHRSFVIGRSLSVIGGGAGNWKIRGSRRHRFGGGRAVALEISGLVWLAGTPARRYLHREGQFPILLSARYLHSHQHCAHSSRLDLKALNQHGLCSIRLSLDDRGRGGYASARPRYAFEEIIELAVDGDFRLSPSLRDDRLGELGFRPAFTPIR